MGWPMGQRGPFRLSGPWSSAVRCRPTCGRRSVLTQRALPLGRALAVDKYDPSGQNKEPRVDHQPGQAADLPGRGQALAVKGDATKDEMLKEAGIERAKGLITCLGDDAQNLFIVLSARTLNAHMKIVSRNVDPENEGKLTRAGADRVISPYLLGGRYMVNVLTRPRVTEFLGSVTLDSGLELWLEEMVIAGHSQLAGQTVGECDIRQRTGASLVGLFRRASGDMISPDKSTLLAVDDVLIVLGTRQQLASLAEMADRANAT